MNWTLISVVVILAVFSIIGLKKGLLKMAFSLGFSLLAILVTVLIGPGINRYIKSSTEWDDKVIERTREYMSEKGFLLEQDSDVGEDILPKVFQEEINKSAEEYLKKGYEAYNDYVVKTVADFIFSAAVTVGIIIIMILIFLIVNAIIAGVGRLPVIKTVNRFAGMLVGLLFGFVMVSFIFLVLMIFNNSSLAETVYKDIASNPFLSFIYNRNLLLIVITNIF